MSGDPSELTLRRVEAREEVEALVAAVFSDPEARRGMGWTESDDPSRAREAIQGLWEHRFEEGWRFVEVLCGGRRAGMAALSPIEEGRAWWAVYLVERGRGLGTRVGRRLLQQARRAGASQLCAITWAENAASRAMLEKLDFDPVGPAPYDWARESQLEWLEYRRTLEA